MLLELEMFRHLRGSIPSGMLFSINILFLTELRTVPAAPNIYRTVISRNTKSVVGTKQFYFKNQVDQLLPIKTI